MLNAFFYNLVPAYFDEICEQKQINARYLRKRILEATLTFKTESKNRNLPQKSFDEMTKYLQKLEMGINENENQPGTSKK